MIISYFKSSFILIIILVFSCKEQPRQSAYEKQINTSRNFFEASFYGSHSVLKASDQKDFKGLSYFKVDSSYCITAKAENISNANPIILHPGGDQTDQFIPSLLLSFSIKNKKHQLTAYKSAGNNSDEYFLPFTDLTSGNSTYGGGRFLDVKLIRNKVILDFNLAYNPTCAYNPKYICPSPPEENHLPVKILVGERIPLIENH